MGKEKLLRLLAVGFGGFLGTILRYLISLKMNESFSESSIPYGTLGVNVVGSFLIGIISELSAYSNMDPTLKIFLTTGILGGLTTFSTMSYETISLLTVGEYQFALLNVLLNIIFGLSAAYLGKLATDLVFLS